MIVYKKENKIGFILFILKKEFKVKLKWKIEQISSKTIQIIPSSYLRKFILYSLPNINIHYDSIYGKKMIKNIHIDNLIFQIYKIYFQSFILERINKLILHNSIPSLYWYSFINTSTNDLKYIF